MKFSVLVPAYNCERWLEDAIRSVRTDSGVDYEIVICNDGSTDRTQDVMQRLADGDGRIRLLRNDANLGGICTRNRLIKEAAGDWIVWLDADDLLAPDFLDISAEALRADPGVGVIRYRYARLYNDGRVKVMNHRSEKADGLEAVVASWLSYGQRFMICSGVWRTDAMREAMPPDTRRIMDDVMYALPAQLAAGCTLYKDTHPMYFYRCGVGTYTQRARTVDTMLAEVLAQRDRMLWQSVHLHRHGLDHDILPTYLIVRHCLLRSVAPAFGVPGMEPVRAAADRWFMPQDELSPDMKSALDAALSGDLSFFQDKAPL